MNAIRALVTCAAVLCLSSSVASPARAQAGDPYRPILSDFHTRSPSRDRSEINAIQFGETLTGGANFTYLDGLDDVSSAGAFIRPDLGTEDEFVIGTSFVDNAGESQFELQTRYTLASSLGLATGYFRSGASGQSDLFFARVNYEVPFMGGKVSLSPVGQRNLNRDYDLGAYAVYTNADLLVGGGFDGEEVRGTVNYAFPTKLGALRPAGEVLYVDNSVGEIDGAEIMLAAGTLGFSGGYLAQGFSMGRVAGPTAVYQVNPVSFTSPAWNRFYDVWEYGDFVSVEALSVQAGDGRTTRYSAVVYPAQLLPENQGIAERVYLGFRHTENDIDNDTDAPVAGYFGPLFGKFSGSVSFAYDFQDEQGELILGLVLVH